MHGWKDYENMYWMHHVLVKLFWRWRMVSGIDVLKWCLCTQFIKWQWQRCQHSFPSFPHAVRNFFHSTTWKSIRKQMMTKHDVLQRQRQRWFSHGERIFILRAFYGAAWGFRFMENMNLWTKTKHRTKTTTILTTYYIKWCFWSCCCLALLSTLDTWRWWKCHSKNVRFAQSCLTLLYIARSLCELEPKHLMIHVYEWNKQILWFHLSDSIL